MTFKCKYNDGIATFTAGDITRSIPMAEGDYNGMAQVMNEIHRLGKRAAVREFGAWVHGWVTEEGWK
jgi:hypothetical protein